MVNNFDNIFNSNFFKRLDFLNNTGMNVFLTVIVMKRRKDDPMMKKDVSFVRQYTIENKNDLLNLKNKIIEQCENNLARAYISVNIRDAREILLNMATKCIEKYKEKGATPQPWNIFWEVAGQSGIVKGEKRWVIDIDNYNVNDYLSHPICIILKNILSQIYINYIDLIDIIPSKSGFHLIVPPFDLMKFKKEIDKYIGKNFELLSDYKNVKDFIKKDNITLLYTLV